MKLTFKQLKLLNATVRRFIRTAQSPQIPNPDSWLARHYKEIKLLMDDINNSHRCEEDFKNECESI